MKNIQRRQMREKRNAMTNNEVIVKSELIRKRLINLPIYKNSNIIMTYVSAKNEPDTIEFIKYALADNKKIVVPITNSDGTLALSYLEDLSDLEEATFGILEPRADRIKNCDKQDIDLILVPGLVFDKSGKRVGYGRGFYDRFLNGLSAVTLAMCYDFQIIEDVAVEMHDIPVNFILTESGLIDCGRK